MLLMRRHAVKVRAAKAKGRAEGEVNLDNMFDDLTDKENPEFRYQYEIKCVGMTGEKHVHEASETMCLWAVNPIFLHHPRTTLLL